MYMFGQQVFWINDRQVTILNALSYKLICSRVSRREALDHLIAWGVSEKEARKANLLA